MMNDQEFIKTKNDLYNLINDRLQNLDITDKEAEDIKYLAKILDEYNLDNRYQMKGLLSRVIVDSLQIDSSLGSKFIKFDRSI